MAGKKTTGMDESADTLKVAETPLRKFVQQSRDARTALAFEPSPHDDPHDSPQERREIGSALGRAIRMLEALLETDGALGIQEICTRLDLPRQSAHRILNQLLNLHLLQRHVGKEQYAIGPRLRYLSLMTAYQSHRNGAWHSVLEKFAHRTKETCNVGIFDQNKVLLIDRIESEYAFRVNSEIGRRLDPHSSSLGKLLLANLPKGRRQMMLEKSSPLRRYTSFTVTDIDELEKEFVEIRRCGYAVSSQGTMLGMLSLAAPIRDSQGRVLAGLGYQAPYVRITFERAIEEIVPVMLEYAEEMTQIVIQEESTQRGASDDKSDPDSF